MGAMEYIETGTQKPMFETLKAIDKKERSMNINKMGSIEIVWHLVKKHKFGLLLAFTSVYVAFSLFGTLIVGLIQSISR